MKTFGGLAHGRGVSYSELAQGMTALQHICDGIEKFCDVDLTNFDQYLKISDTRVRVIWNRGTTFSSICDNYVTYVHTKYKSTALIILDGYPENETIRGTKCAERARKTRKQMSSEAMFDEAMMPTVSQEKFLTNPKNKDQLISILMNKFSSLNIARRDEREIAAVGMPDCFVQCCVFIVGTIAITGRFK
ncbi:hypothetical protein AVEN_162019-1 [Araneus ventricosus]|uniref:Uncharacterized protein n=1 Tax=Araneus ventricosus TaxID=182803 RepID=A0A4Y2F6T7_ARAVE|nr:hypothetical protein AVEN_162019-1 [Araneus ventricosus]